MNLRERLQESMKDAMLKKESARLSSIRLIIAKLKEKDIDARGKGNSDGIADDEILAMLQSMIKQRQESISLYQQGGRAELAAKEEAEIHVIQQFLPRQMDSSEAENAIRGLIAELQASSIKDMGKVMAELKARYGGQLDMGKASGQIKSLLGG